MRILKLRALLLVFVVASGARAQQSHPLEKYLGISGKQRPLAPLPAPEGFADHTIEGRVVLSLDDAVRLALLNNLDIRIDQTNIDTARDNVFRQYSLFDPLATSSFNDQRQKSQTFTQLSGASVLNTLSQTTTLGYAQTFPTGTNFQTTFSLNKLSTNSSFSTINPSFFSTWQFTVTQPLLRNFGVFPNKAPIYIAQRNLKVAESTFRGQVSDLLLQVVTNYWNVVLARGSLDVSRKSLEEAQKSYDRDKKALGLGALPPLDIYRSESQVAARKVSVIQAEYALKFAEDQFRQIIAADRDPATRVLDLDLTEAAEPRGEMLTMDIPTALDLALANRPELESIHQQQAADALNLRLAHNNLKPDLELSGFYIPSGLGGNEYSSATPPVLLSRGGVGDSLSQLFGLSYPTYGASLSLTLPIRNHFAEANLGDALVTEKADQLREGRTKQSVLLDVTTAVRQLEQAKLSLEASKVSRELAVKNLQAEERKYQLGSSTVFFVLDAQTQLAQAEFTLVQSQTSYQLALAAVDHATGKLLDRYEVKLKR